MLRTLVHHRGYILRAAWADVRRRYAGSAIGIAWNVIQPLALILIFTIVFTEVVTGRSDPSVPGGYPVYLCSLLLPWLAFAEGVGRGTRSLVDGAMYLRKLPIPEEVFTAVAVVSAGIGLAISLTVFMPIASLLGQPVTWHWLFVPLSMVFMLLLVLGLAVGLAAVHAFIRDTGTIVQILLQVGFWSYPIVYGESFLPSWMAALLPFHPLHGSFSATRDMLLHARLPGWESWALMVGWSAIALGVGAVVMNRLRAEIRDVL